MNALLDAEADHLLPARAIEPNKAWKDTRAGHYTASSHQGEAGASEDSQSENPSLGKPFYRNVFRVAPKGRVETCHRS